MKSLTVYAQEQLAKPVALYVHGLNSNFNSSTFKALKKNFPQLQWFSSTFDLEHPSACTAHIQKLVSRVGAEYLVGSSLGAFYVLSCPMNVKKIVINPCLEPWLHVNKVKAGAIDPQGMEQLKQLQKNISLEAVFGVFGDRDELFSYISSFDQDHRVIVHGGHRLDDHNLVKGITSALDHFKINEGLLMEHFTNIFVQKTDTKNRDLVIKYKDVVWDMLLKTYERCGGIAGCNSADELVADSEFWKLVTKNGRVLAAFIYNFKRGGRKCQYACCDGTAEGKDAFYTVVKDDIRLKDRETWMEVSGAPEHVYRKHGMVPIPADVAKKILADKEFISINKDGYHYTRLIGGEPHEKILLGNIKF